MSPNILTTSESARLESLEKQIERGRKHFVEVGVALSEVRDGKLYRGQFKTFEDYCREKWGWSRSYCHRIIEASSVVKEMLPMGNIITTERQARALSQAEPEHRAEIVQKIVDSGEPVTASSIKKQIVIDADDACDPPHIQTADEAFKCACGVQKDSPELLRLKIAWEEASTPDRTAFRKWID